MQRHNQPVTLFGISLKGLITALVFLVTLFVVFDQVDMKSMFSETISSIQKKQNDDNQPGHEDTLVATPEMVSKAISEIRASKKHDHEKTDTVSPTDRFFYIVELYNGGDIEASDVTIEPELVTIISKSGIETVIPRTTIKKIRRYKLPDPVQPQSTQ
jgi:hypothetical protein